MAADATPLIRDLELRLAAEESSDAAALLREAARRLGVGAARIAHVELLRRSLDARPRRAVWQLRVRVWIDEPAIVRSPPALRLRDVASAPPVVVVGAGPGGLFAALELIEAGLRPVVLERGKAVRERRRDVAFLCRQGLVDPESNYCFGEGGAGTFSDGKLYTRSDKRGDIARVLESLVACGAPPDILVDAHPHVGSNRLPLVVQRLTNAIREAGGEVRFGARVNGLLRDRARVAGVRLAGGESVEAGAVVLATGHSARDVYAMLAAEGVAMEAKPFALGVRVEHPQPYVDRIRYRVEKRPPHLPPASYSVVRRVAGRGVYSFCMCPGGIACPATTSPDEVVVNGWSPSGRNSRWANSGVVVELGLEDFAPFESGGVLAGMELQAAVERRAAELGGGLAKAPAQRLGEFVSGRASTTVAHCSYRPGVVATDVAAAFPPPIAAALREGLARFEEKMPGYVTDEAVVLGVESRTSAPVRILREPATGTHPSAPGLFPCGEGAGAAGGIVSAAMDGQRAAACVKRYV